MWFGESEANVREVFDNEVLKMASNQPADKNP